MIRFLATIFGAAMLAGCATGGELIGTASSRERIALPPEAEFSATLIAVDEGKDTALGSFASSAADGPLYRFAIAYRRAALSPRHRYFVEAKIAWRGERYFYAREQLTDFPRAPGAAIAIVMARTATRPGLRMPDGSVQAPSGSPVPSDNPAERETGAAVAGGAIALFGTHWRLLTIDGRTVAATGPSAPGMTLTRNGDGARMSGRTGCNRIAGSARVDGTSIRFEPIVSTQMACVSAADLRAAKNAASSPSGDIEAKFGDALRRTTRFAIVDGRLSLFSADGSVVASFAAGDD